MKNLYLITGGARSGKSSYAETIAKELGQRVTYIATAKTTDEDMVARIKYHQQSRPQSWSTIECYKGFVSLVDLQSFIQSDILLLDCMTIMVSNLLLEEQIDYDTCGVSILHTIEKKIFKEINQLLTIIKQTNKTLIIVTNEVGFGVVPAYRLGNIFRDIAGRVNQFLAKEAEFVYVVLSGIPLKIK